MHSARSPAPLILWEFSTELFEVATAERMLDHFLNLIESSVRDPEAHLSSLSMMGGEERNRVLGLDARACHAFSNAKCRFIASSRQWWQLFLRTARLSLAMPHLAIIS